MYSLKNKTAIVTGGGSPGLEKRSAVLFAQQGARVYLLDIDEKGATETVKEIMNRKVVSLNISTALLTRKIL